MMVVSEYCEKCFYRKTFTSMGPYCDYLCMVGRPRPCPAGDGCTARVLMKRTGPEPISLSNKPGRTKREKTEEEIAAAKEAKRQRNREYARKHYANMTDEEREKDREKCRKYYREHKAERTAAHREYYHANREKINAQNREWKRKKREEQKNGDTA